MSNMFLLATTISLYGILYAWFHYKMAGITNKISSIHNQMLGLIDDIKETRSILRK
jgi:hypothetical protein